MNILKHLLQQITSALMTSMIITTMVLLPFPNSISLTYAAEEEVTENPDCEENINDDGSAGIYKPGCDFNKALTKVNEDKYGGGIAGIIEQFIGAAFALAATSAVTFTHTPRSMYDCPQNQNANITIRMMQLGSLAYLIGELQAKNEYSKASKLATDNRFAIQQKKDELAEDKKEAKQNKEDNNKQIEAYAALMKIMDHQIEALDKKKNMAMVAEASYLAATGVETVLTYQHKAVCSAGELKKAGELIAEISTETSIASGASSSAVCSDVGVVLNADLGQKVSCDKALDAKGVADTAVSVAKSSKDVGMIAKVFAGLVNSFTLGLSQFIGDTPPLPVESEIATDKAQALANLGASSTCNIADKSSSIAVQGTCAAQASKTVAAPACIAACEAGYLAVAKRIVLTETLKKKCCGADYLAPTAGGEEVTPSGPGIMDIKTDIYIPPIKTFFTGDTKIDFHKAIVINTLYRTYFELVNKNKNLSPQERINQIASLHEMTEYIDLNFEDLIMNSDSQREFQKQLRGVSPSGLNDFLADGMLSLRDALVKDAKASAFGELLGFGVKLFAMQYFLGEYMRNTFLVKPLNRIITFGTMSALNGAILVFTNKAKNKAESRYEIIRKEAQRFANSHSLKTDIIEQNEDGSNGKLNLKKSKMTAAQLANAGFKTCAKPKKGGSFVPTLCPNVARRKSFSLPKFKSGGDSGISPLFGQAAGLITDITHGAASGHSYTDPASMSASLGELNGLRNALKKQNAYLVKKYDNQAAKLKVKKGTARAPSLSAASVKMRKIFSGGANSVTPAQLENVGRDLSKLKIEKLGGSGKADVGRAATVPTFSMPKTPKFDFDLGNSDSASFDEDSESVNTGGEQNLNDYQVNNGEINQNPGVSIFKVISNRYLRSYPVLLEEK